MTRFRDRTDAGKALADVLAEHAYEDPVILALPRGGAPVAIEVARRLRAPMDLVMVRKIGVPSQPELAAAAIVNGDDPQIVVNDHVARAVGLSRDDIDALAEVQLEEIRRRRGVYLQGRSPLPIQGRTAIVVDDGIATGATMRVSLKALGKRNPAQLVLAVPVAPKDVLEELQNEVDHVVCLTSPVPFWSVGSHFSNFGQTSDEEVVQLLNEANALDRSGDEPLDGE